MCPISSLFSAADSASSSLKSVFWDLITSNPLSLLPLSLNFAFATWHGPWGLSVNAPTLHRVAIKSEMESELHSRFCHEWIFFFFFPIQTLWNGSSLLRGARSDGDQSPWQLLEGLQLQPSSSEGRQCPAKNPREQCQAFKSLETAAAALPKLGKAALAVCWRQQLLPGMNHTLVVPSLDSPRGFGC